MKKVILNKCYGGFGLSDEALELYAKKKGLRNLINVCSSMGGELDRADPLLVEVVEELGPKRAGGEYSALSIVEVPDDVADDYMIDDYDGFETMHKRAEVY